MINFIKRKKLEQSYKMIQSEIERSISKIKNETKSESISLTADKILSELQKQPVVYDEAVFNLELNILNHLTKSMECMRHSDINSSLQKLIDALFVTFERNDVLNDYISKTPRERKASKKLKKENLSADQYHKKEIFEIERELDILQKKYNLLYELHKQAPKEIVFINVANLLKHEITYKRNRLHKLTEPFIQGRIAPLENSKNHPKTKKRYQPFNEDEIDELLTFLEKRVTACQDSDEYDPQKNSNAIGEIEKEASLLSAKINSLESKIKIFIVESHKLLQDRETTPVDECQEIDKAINTLYDEKRIVENELEALRIRLNIIKAVLNIIALGKSESNLDKMTERAELLIQHIQLMQRIMDES